MWQALWTNHHLWIQGRFLREISLRKRLSESPQIVNRPMIVVREPLEGAQTPTLESWCVCVCGFFFQGANQVFCAGRGGSWPCGCPWSPRPALHFWTFVCLENKFSRPTFGRFESRHSACSAQLMKRAETRCMSAVWADGSGCGEDE